MLRTQSKRNQDLAAKNPIRQQKQIRPGSGRLRGAASGRTSAADGVVPLSQEEARMVRRVKEEYVRRGGWVEYTYNAKSCLRV
ncbi:hypothetical protein EB796_025169 [Bugula neritina]|nr:hypothetical protein EB796_025169 [Bugula neritina]